MLTESEYKSKLARAEELCALDPDANSPEGLLLLSLVDELQEYERANFPFEISKADIAMIRGYVPSKCNFCGRDLSVEELEPEEAGEWACHYCLLRWAQEDGNTREALFWERIIKERKCRRIP
jgi:hypothetical protein